MARKKNRDIFADNTQNTDATQAAAPPVEKETRRQRKKRQANMTLEEMTAETDKQLFGDKLEPNLSRNSVPDVIPEGEPKSDRYKTVISKGPEKERIVTRTKEEEGTGTGTAITNAMSNTAVTNGGSLYDKAVADNPNMTFEETQELAGKLATADQEKENVEADADAVIGEKVNEVISDVEGATDGAVEGDGDMEQGGAGAPTPNAQSQALMNIGGGGAGAQGPPDYESEADVNKVRKDIAQAQQLAAGRDAYVPQAVVEQLGVQDYFPTMGRDIAKGTWTGSVLGSQTIYAGGGMVLPMGLYDARKRALNQAAKEKQATIDKLLELPNTADQFNTRYQDYGYEFINSNLDKFGSYSAMAADPEFKRKMAEFKNIGKELMYVDKWADGKITDLANPEKYVPKEIIEDLYKFKSGIMENLDEALDGKGDIPQMINNLRSFESGIAMVDNLVKEGMFDENRLDQAPISLNTGAINADPEGWGKFQNDMLKVVNNDGSIDNDTYVTGLMKFFDTSKAENIINGLFQGNLDERTRGSVLKYLLSQAPKKVVYDYQSMGNQSAKRAADAMAQKRWAAEFEQRKKENETIYQYMNRQMSDSNKVNGKSLDETIAGIQKNSKLNPVQKMYAIAKATEQYNIGTPSVDRNTGAVVWTRSPTQYMKDNPTSLTAKSKVRVKKYNSKTKKYDDIEMPYNQFLGLNKSNLKSGGKDLYRYSNGAVITPESVQDIRATANTRMQTTALQATKATWNNKTGQYETVTNKNIDRFDPKNTRNVERMTGFVEIQIEDKNGNPMYKRTPLEVVEAVDISEGGGVNFMDGRAGYNAKSLQGTYQNQSSTSYGASGYE